MKEVLTYPLYRYIWTHCTYDMSGLVISVSVACRVEITQQWILLVHYHIVLVSQGNVFLILPKSLLCVSKYHWHALLTANLTILPGPLISLTRPKCLNKEGSSTLEQLYQFHVDYSNEEIDYNIFIGPESDHCLPLSLTHSLTDSVTFSKLNWCNPGVWRYQLKTCWCCNCCWWGSCWQQFAADFEAEVWSKS